MTSERAGRRRDSTRSRELLLQAAVELFAEHGFERTTTRDIGERAGVDAALIARYFGSKTQLYLATLGIDSDAEPEDLLSPQRLFEMLERTDQRGLGPHIRIIAQPLTDPQAQQAARAGLHERLVEPLCKRFTKEGLNRPRLRAEAAVAAVVGVMLGRRSGAFDELGEADPGELATLLQDALSGSGAEA